MRQMATPMLAGVLATTLAACATTGVTNVGSAQGYRISFVKSTPRPGTAIRPKDLVTFTVTVRYDLSVTDNGRIVLVFQNEKNELLLPGEKQQSLEVARGSHEVTLSQRSPFQMGSANCVCSFRLFLREHQEVRANC